MSTAPLPPGLRPGGAAEIERDLEQPSIGVSAAKSQVFDLADFRFRRAVTRPHRLSEQPAITSIGTTADSAWRNSEPPSLNDSGVHRLRSICASSI
jgi:hypothetical protein